jgi:perosamine synthetase
MVAGLIPKTSKLDRDEVIKRMAERGIETRPVFPCLSWLPMYKTEGDFERSKDISTRGICLPTHANLIEYDVATVCSTLNEVIHGEAP